MLMFCEECTEVVSKKNIVKYVNERGICMRCGRMADELAIVKLTIVDSTDTEVPYQE